MRLLTLLSIPLIAALAWWGGRAFSGHKSLAGRAPARDIESHDPTAPERRPPPDTTEDPTGAQGQTAALWRATIDREFSSQKPDATWSQAAQGRIRQGLQGFVDGNSSLGHLECRSSVCVAKLTHANERSYFDFLQRAIHPGLWPGQIYFTRGDDTTDDRKQMLMYFGREGTALPTPPSSRSVR
jgi:hypothetical protein